MHTTHGAHVPGTKLGNNPPARFPRCGGIRTCPDCALEAAAVDSKLDYVREEFYDEDTHKRVFLALCEAGADEALAGKALSTMLEHGILFRERKPRT